MTDKHVPGCTGKVRFESRSAAQAVRKRSKHISGQPERKLHVYRCQSCGGWHLSSWSACRAETEANNRAATETLGAS